jgi:hypothetical protein
MYCKTIGLAGAFFARNSAQEILSAAEYGAMEMTRTYYQDWLHSCPGLWRSPTGKLAGSFLENGFAVLAFPISRGTGQNHDCSDLAAYNAPLTIN